MTTRNPVKFLVFDVESVADGQLVRKIRFPGETLDPQQAVRRYRDELMEKNGSDFIPHSFQFPVSVVVGKILSDFQLDDIVALDDPAYRPHVLTEHFWQGWEAYRRPTLVSFNGRGFDIPLLELSAFRYGISVPGWMASKGPTYQQPRNRYNAESHLDLCDVWTNYGACRFSGGLNLAASILGKPGKMDIQGHMVQDLYDEGKLREINDYCRCDVLDTYFVFLRTMVVWGNLSLEREQELVAETKQWLQERTSQWPVYQCYLDRWGDWANPWSELVATAGG